MCGRRACDRSVSGLGALTARARSALALILMLALPGSCMLLAPSTDELASALSCPTGTKVCDNSCAAVDNPVTGCALSGCEPCVLPHAAAGCKDGACSIDVCEATWADCDGDTANGCEIPLPAGRQGCSCESIRFLDDLGSLVVDTSVSGPVELGDGDFTVEFWVMRSADAHDPADLYQLFTSSSPDGASGTYPLPFFRLAIGPTYFACNTYDGGAPGENAISVQAGLPLNRWTHVACSHEGDQLVAYLDGVEKTRVPYHSGSLALDAPVIGASGTPTLAGYELGPLRVSRVARYQGAFAPATHWSVDDATVFQYLVFSPYLQLGPFDGRIYDESASGLIARSRGGVTSGEQTPCDASP